MTAAASQRPDAITTALPAHLAGWQLPPGWHWGTEGVRGEHRHTQEIVDALGRSLALVTAPDPQHARWLEAEARFLAHRSSHPSIPTTYHYWAQARDAKRGPGYLRRWIAGETLGARARRLGPMDIPNALQLLRAVGSALAYLHDTGAAHGALSGGTVGVTPAGRYWLLGWQWAVGRGEIPTGLRPDFGAVPSPPEWQDGWAPSAASDQWMLAAICFAALTGETPPASDIPPVRWLRHEVPERAASVIDRALLPDPGQRHGSVSAMLRAIERAHATRTTFVVPDPDPEAQVLFADDEAKLRWAVSDDYEVISKLGTGTFGSVWRVRDLALEREVALKVLHPRVAVDDVAVSRFRREAKLAAQLAHPAIVPIYDWDARGDVSWYTMELAEGGSVANLMARAGARPLAEVAGPVDAVLDGLNAAHSVGIIHRDLKPENLLIDRYRRWRITDFGIANETGAELGGASGTPAFAAPEQLLGEAQGPAADCFAIAAIVAYVLSGVPPFGDRSSKEILARELAGRVDLSSFSEHIAGWLRKGLAADPEQRYPDAAAMQDAWRTAVRRTLRTDRRRAWWERLLGRPPAPPPPHVTGVPRRSLGY